MMLLSPQDDNQLRELKWTFESNTSHNFKWFWRLFFRQQIGFILCIILFSEERCASTTNNYSPLIVTEAVIKTSATTNTRVSCTNHKVDKWGNKFRLTVTVQEATRINRISLRHRKCWHTEHCPTCYPHQIDCVLFLWNVHYSLLLFLLFSLELRIAFVTPCLLILFRMLFSLQEVLHTICNPYGQVQRIVIFKKNGVQAMVEYPFTKKTNDSPVYLGAEKVLKIPIIIIVVRLLYLSLFYVQLLVWGTPEDWNYIFDEEVLIMVTSCIFMTSFR